MEKLFTNAFWCRCMEGEEYTLYRRNFDSAESAGLELAVSADCRYNLYLDGKFIGRGPRRGDLEHYFYEIYHEDVKPGKHVLAVEVLEWQDRMNYPWSEIHWSSAFLAAGHCGMIDLSTPGDWRCCADHSRRTLKWSEALKTRSVFPALPMEKWTFDFRLSDWKKIDFDDSEWTIPECLGRPALKAQLRADPPTRWKLIPDDLPQMLTEPIRNISVLSADFPLPNPKDTVSAEIPSGKHTLLLDLGCYYTHLISLRGCGGNGTCRIAYGEALYNAENKREFRGPFPNGKIGENGYGDLLVFNGGKFEFQPFWYRAGRFVELEFELTAPMKINSISFEFIHFPLTLKKNFHSPEDPVLEKIFQTGWQTALCCAHEHYEDCPYWEQMQYAGDTRIQALISYELAGEGRLGRQAIRQFDWSRLGSGLTMSRYPANFRQVIPKFSLFWIMMIADYVEYFGDDGIVAEHWDGIRDVLNYFEKKRLDSGLIGDADGWNFSDWVEGWPGGCSNRNLTEPDTMLNLIYAEACRMAAEMNVEEAAEYEKRKTRVLNAVNANCRTAEGIYQDVPGHDWFSQHTNIWAILSGAVPADERAALTEKILHDKRFSQCTLYFQFYMLELLRREKNRNGFRAVLKNWENILEQGFTTFPEWPSLATRSDCHAWSAGPCYHLLKYER